MKPSLFKPNLSIRDLRLEGVSVHSSLFNVFLGTTFLGSIWSSVRKARPMMEELTFWSGAGCCGTGWWMVESREVVLDLMLRDYQCNRVAYQDKRTVKR